MQENIRNSKYYSKLVVNRKLRLVLFLTILVSFISLFLFLHFNYSVRFDSLVIIIPSVIISSLVLFIPLTEEWEYCAWNSKVYSLEKHATVVLDDSVNF